MSKEYTALGLMSGTSGDGVDASVIISNGENSYNVIKDKYFEYDNSIYEKFHKLKETINNLKDLEKYSEEIKNLERQITIFQAKIIQNFDTMKIDLVGCHGQTIFHSGQKKFSRQLTDGKLLSQLTKKNIVYDFRQNDLQNGGEGAPLSPIFHQLLATKFNLDLPVCFLNIGGISNITVVNEFTGSLNFLSKDIGPGNCLIDLWIRKNSKNKFDKDGNLARLGKSNEVILEQAEELFANRIERNTSSFDVNDFDVSFARGLSLEDGAATLTDFTSKIIGAELTSVSVNLKINQSKIILCGGGRKNNLLIEKIRKNTLESWVFKNVDDFGVNGDFIESQAFAFLAIRSLKKLPISFPKTTGCNKPISGGKIINY